MFTMIDTRKWMNVHDIAPVDTVLLAKASYSTQLTHTHVIHLGVIMNPKREREFARKRRTTGHLDGVIKTI